MWWNRLLWSRQPLDPRHPAPCLLACSLPRSLPPTPQLSRKPRHYYQLPMPCSASQYNADTNYPAIFPPGEDDVGRAVNTVAVSVVASPHMRLCHAHLTSYYHISYIAVKFVDTAEDKGTRGQGTRGQGTRDKGHLFPWPF